MTTWPMSLLGPRSKPLPPEDLTYKPLSIVQISHNETQEQVLSTLRSIDGQIGVKWDFIEVIVVNDAGTPLHNGAFTGLRNFTPRYIVRDTNGGPLKARQTGFEAATGQYITFFDTQDVFAYAFALHLFQRVLAKDDYDFIFSARIREDKINHDDTECQYLYEQGTLFNFHGKVFNCDFLRDAKIQWLDEWTIDSEDEFFLRQVFDAGEINFGIPDPFYLYRYSRNGLTKDGAENEFYARIYAHYLSIMEQYLDITAAKFPDIMEERVTYFFIKTYLFLGSEYFAKFPAHAATARKAFKHFYGKFREHESRNIRLRAQLQNMLATEIYEQPVETYDEFIREFR
jgi:glycosyltransferase involved in cell wall biosynthesis